MKTQTKGFASFLKKIAITSFIMAVATSCGGNNRSGNNTPLNTTGIYGGLGTTVVNGQTINLGAAVQRLATQMQCANYGGYGGYGQQQQINNNRVRSVIQISGSGTLYKPVVGITTEGDIAVVRTSGAGFIMEVYACQRPGAVNAQATLNGNPAQPLSYSFSCMDGLVASVSLRGAYAPYTLNFFPATPNQQVARQICGL